MRLRRELHARGLRYFVQRPVVPGTRRHVDIVFPRAKVAVDVRGCFWHACPLHGTSSRSNSAYWAGKLAANTERDADTERRLADADWLLVVVWEHDDPAAAADAVAEALSRRRGAAGGC